MDLVNHPTSEEDERKLKNLATRVMSNGVEVLVKDKNSTPEKYDQRKTKLMPVNRSAPPKRSLLNRQHIFRLPVVQHNYVIKTCLTTFTYLKTVVQNQRSSISTFETIVSMVTTESLTNLYATDLIADIKPTKTKLMDFKTIEPSAANVFYRNDFPKIEKRIDDENEQPNFDVIQPSEVGHIPCTSSCSCSHEKTEALKTKHPSEGFKKPAIKASKYGGHKVDVRPTTIDKKTKYPYEYEANTQSAPTDRIVEKYTEVINDYSEEKESGSVEESELLTNEKAPAPPKQPKTTTKKPEKLKTEKPHKPNKNKFFVADLLKLGTLGIKGLSQLAPVIEKMTGGFMSSKKPDFNKSTTTTTQKPVTHLTPYNVNKRIDSDIEVKHNFPIYIPVDEMETSESQTVYTNATLHQNLVWASSGDQKHSKDHIPNKMIHESPLVNGGIPISPGEIITANSDVIVGKPAVGGPLTLAASGIRLQNPVNPPPLDSFVAGSETYSQESLSFKEPMPLAANVDDSYDLRPPEIPRPKPKPSRDLHRPMTSQGNNQESHNRNVNKNHPHVNKMPSRPFSSTPASDNMMKTDYINTKGILGNHGRPAFIDYIPSLAKPPNDVVSTKQQMDLRPSPDSKDEELDNSPSSSEIVDSKVNFKGEKIPPNGESNKPFLVDIQPSKVANVIIPHGSATALVFAGSSEPHKTGDYFDESLPYPEPGYFGSFSIDAPQMTNVHNVPTTGNKSPKKTPVIQSHEPYHSSSNPALYKTDQKYKRKENKRPDYHKLPPPTSNQETHFHIGPQITVYNPDIYKPTGNGKFEKYNNKYNKDGKEIIDKEYENYLAVPPPPPPKMAYHESYDKNHFSNKPVVHTKPIQDMKVFLNIQHPVPKPHQNHDQVPPKVTSEVYYAAQSPSSANSPAFTMHIPSAPNSNQHSYNKYQHNNQVHQSHPDSFQVVSSPNIANAKPSIIKNNNDNDGTYTVTLNTATNVASNIGETGQIFGSSIAVPVDAHAVNTDIPIGTNFAIRVEDAPNFETYDTKQKDVNKDSSDSQHAFSTKKEEATIETTSRPFVSSTLEYTDNNNKNENSQSPVPSLNSHANFPTINDPQFDVKPVTEYIEDVKPEQKRPAKLIPNAPTNSHGWYSNVPFDDIKNINNIDVSTRKSIPLLYEYNRKQPPNFGQKITDVGKPPTGYWSTNKPEDSISYQNEEKTSTIIPETNKNTDQRPFTRKPIHPNYIPQNFGVIKQQVYDIPIRDNSDETTTAKTNAPNRHNEVYETSHEVYDGQDEDDSENDSDGEISQESMNVDVVSSSTEKDIRAEDSKLSNEITLLKDEVIDDSKLNKNNNQGNNFVDFNPGTQTEKPFDVNSYNKTSHYQSNSMKPIYDNNNPKPRPFTVNSATTLEHQLHQPHWQINEMLENSTNESYEDTIGIDLNIGEEMQSATTHKPSTQQISNNEFNKYKKPQRPVFSVRGNNSIITSTIQIQDKKPLTLAGNTNEKSSTYSTLSSSEIIDLSPPPPTMDYSFKPSSTDETIMGMSPPPNVNSNAPPMRPIPSRSPASPRPTLPPRTPPPYRTKPPRTITPRMPTQRPTRKPINRDEVSTYRPTYDILNNIKKPNFNRDYPSSQLIPPLRNPINELPAPSLNLSNNSNVVFPTAISSGWLTSSGIDFSSKFDFAPTSVLFPEKSTPSDIHETPELSSTELSTTTKEQNIDDVSTESISKINTSSEESLSDVDLSDNSKESTSTEKISVIPLRNRYNRTRKPYPPKEEDIKSNSIKYKAPPKPTVIIRPTKTLSRPDVLYPTRQAPSRILPKPLPPKSSILRPGLIQSSESSIVNDPIQPTEVLHQNDTYEPNKIDASVIERTPPLDSSIINKENEVIPLVKPTVLSENDVKLKEEVPPVKTEFKTTIITLTKTLLEPPQTISNIDFINVTHTLTVTQTKTSLVSQSEGAVTETLTLFNTLTSTIVDVITEIRTEVQPVTIIETVTKHIPIQIEPTPVREVPTKTKIALDDITMSSEDTENFIIKDTDTTENVHKVHDNEGDNDTFFVVVNKSQNGGNSPPIINSEIETSDYDGVTRNEQVNSNGVSQVLFGEILLAGAPYLETTNVGNGGVPFSKECQPDCKASRNERCQRIDGIMKCVCRPGFARMFPDRPCKPTYTYSVKLALNSHGKDRLTYNDSLADNSTSQYQMLSLATHEGINRMIMQSDLRDVYHGIHITGFEPVEMRNEKREVYQGVVNDFYVQLSDNAHESRLKEVLEKYLRNNNYSLGGTEVHAASELIHRLNVSDFDECLSGQFHDCSEYAQCFNLRGTYTCSCLEGYADLSVNSLYPGRICSAEPVGCERCNYHGACYSRDDKRVLCECFPWYAGSTCNVNLKVVLISLGVIGGLLLLVLIGCAAAACCRPNRHRPRVVTCIQAMPNIHQTTQQSKQRADRRALINERTESGDTASMQNASLPYMPVKKQSGCKKLLISEPPSHAPPLPPPAAVMIPRARLHQQHRDSREMVTRKQSMELSSEDKLISYLENGASTNNEEMMRRKHSMESSYSAPKERHNKQGALVSAGFKVSTTIRGDEPMMKHDDDMSSVKNDLESELRFDSLRKSYSQDDLSEWTDAERRLGELTLSEARSVGGTLPASTGRAASSTRLTHQEANTMAERDLGSTFLLPHVHLYKPDITSDVSEFDSL